MELAGHEAALAKCHTQVRVGCQKVSCVAVCCSVLQFAVECAAVRCSVLQCAVECALECVAVCCSVL